MPLIRYCERCAQPSRELTHCVSVDQWLCEQCIMDLAVHYYTTTFLPSIIPFLPDDGDER